MDPASHPCGGDRPNQASRNRRRRDRPIHGRVRRLRFGGPDPLHPYPVRADPWGRHGATAPRLDHSLAHTEWIYRSCRRRRPRRGHRDCSSRRPVHRPAAKTVTIRPSPATAHVPQRLSPPSVNGTVVRIRYQTGKTWCASDHRRWLCSLFYWIDHSHHSPDHAMIYA